MRETLILSYRDVERLIDVDSVISAVEEGFKFKSLGFVNAPPKQYVFIKDFNGDFRVMPCYCKKNFMAGVKIVNVHPGNPKRGFRSVMALIELIDPETGYPLAVMDGTVVTEHRTGAAGAVAIKYLARGDSSVLGIIGAGVQGRMQALYASRVMKLEKILVYDINAKTIERFIEYVKSNVGVGVEAKNSPESVVRESDVLVTCTPARSPVVKGEWVRKGMHINAIGADAPGKRELDTKTILKANKIVVDDYEQAIHSGELNVPISSGEVSRSVIYGEIGEVIAGLKKGRELSSEITIFDSTGIAIQDVAVAKLVYDKAVREDVGLKLEIVKSKL